MQELFPEIQAGIVALEKRIELTESEIAEMKESMGAKKKLVREWKKAVAGVNPQLARPKKKAAAQ